MTSQDVARAIFAGNDVAMQWYALTHQTAIPGAAGTVVVTSPESGGFSASFGSGTLLLIGAAIIGLVLILKK